MGTATITSLRRTVAVATAGIALVAMAAGPALAAGGYLSVDRGFKLAGDRDSVSVVIKVTRAAMGAGLGFGVGFGKEGTVNSVAMALRQDGRTAGSRMLKIDGYSAEYKDVQGASCHYEYRLSCDKTGYDWVEGRPYRVSFVRGGKNAQGYLWTVSIRDLQTKTLTKLVSFRTSFAQLSTSSLNGAYLYANPSDCSNIAPVAAVVRKPVAPGSTVTWEGGDKYKDGCDNATLASPLVDGAVKFSIK